MGKCFNHFVIFLCLQVVWVFCIRFLNFVYFIKNFSRFLFFNKKTLTCLPFISVDNPDEDV